MSVTVERTPDGRRVCVARVVAAPRERAWDLLTDTQQWLDWGPSVRGVETTARYVERGTTGRVLTPIGVWVPFEITTCEDYRWTWRVAKIPATGHRVETVAGDDRGEKRCRVVFEVPIPAAGYVPVCQRALARIETLLRSSR